jgi:uncharacterized protein YbaR (Trm112 family)
MGLPKKLLEKLACPQCKGPLDPREREERLECLGCKLSYSVVDGIPVLLIDEAKRL